MLREADRQQLSHQGEQVVRQSADQKVQRIGIDVRTWQGVTTKVQLPFLDSVLAILGTSIISLPFLSSSGCQSEERYQVGLNESVLENKLGITSADEIEFVEYEALLSLQTRLVDEIVVDQPIMIEMLPDWHTRRRTNSDTHHEDRIESKV